MRFTKFRGGGRVLAVSLGSVAAIAAATVAPGQVDASSTHLHFGKHNQVLSGLDNPRQLSVAPNGDLILAEAGHGSYNKAHCGGHGQNRICVGQSGKILRIGSNGSSRVVMKGLLSGAGPDGTFAVGSDGAGKRPGGAYYSIITYAPKDVIPQPLPSWQDGKLLAKPAHGGHLHKVANISAYERRHDPDGEGFDSDPYSVLALRHQVLVADAAGDDILSVNRAGKISLWALLPEYGKKLDAVPTVLTKGSDGKVYVGELHSEVPGAAKVWKYDRHGKVLRSWGGFTTVTGVARAANGNLYVSELFGGKCTPDQIPTCFPGRVVRITPDGDRSYRKVPLPAGVAVTHGKVYVSAFSIASANGAFGNPDWSGAVWRIFHRS